MSPIRGTHPDPAAGPGGEPGRRPGTRPAAQPGTSSGAAAQSAPQSGGAVAGGSDSRSGGASDAPSARGTERTARAARQARKQVLLRLDPQVYDALARWAGEELRSANAQIEFLLRRALADSGRLPGGAAPIPPRGRPRTSSDS